MKRNGKEKYVRRKYITYYFVLSLCTLNGNILLSSGYDRLIKVWTISDVELTFIKEIKEHTSNIKKVIPLSKERSASCSTDMTAKVWKDDTTYK